MMKYKIALFGRGGQYTFGAVTTASDIDAIHSAIDSGTVSSAIERNGDWELENNDLDNMLIEAYGPEKDETKITVISFSSNIDDFELVYMDEDNDGEVADADLLSTFENLLLDYNESSEKFSKFLLEPILVEGKGEWENDINVILTKENDLIYEG